MKKEFKKWPKDVYLLLFATVSLLFLSLIILFVVIVFITRNEKISREGKRNLYQYFQNNIKTNDTFNGFTTLPYTLDDEDFISYSDENNNEVLISNFGTKKYRCTGSCVYETPNEDGDNRRSSGITSFKPFTFLVAAVTSFVAIQQAKKHFEDECSHYLLKQSDLHKNRGIKKDNRYRRPKNRIREYRDDESFILHEVECDAVEDEFGGGVETLCKGKCIPRSWTHDPGNRYFGRNKLPTDFQLSLYSIARDLEGYECQDLDVEMVYDKPIYMAQEIFVEQDLFRFCKEASKQRLTPSRELKDFLEQMEIPFEMLYDQNTAHGESGYIHIIGGGRHQNEEVKYFLVDVCTSGRLDPDDLKRGLWFNDHVKCFENRSGVKKWITKE